MKVSTTLKPLVFAIAAAMALAVQAQTGDEDDPLLDRRAGDASASVSRDQYNGGDNTVSNEGTENTVELSDSLEGNDGNVGANFAAGVTPGAPAFGALACLGCGAGPRRFCINRCPPPAVPWISAGGAARGRVLIAGAEPDGSHACEPVVQRFCSRCPAASERDVRCRRGCCGRGRLHGLSVAMGENGFGLWRITW